MRPTIQNHDHARHVLTSKVIHPIDQPILDTLIDGVFILATPHTAQNSTSNYLIRYTNQAFSNLVGKKSLGLVNLPISKIFNQNQYASLHHTLEQVSVLNSRVDLDITYYSKKTRHQLRMSIVPHQSADQEAQIICSVTDITALSARAVKLEERAETLIDLANTSETSRRTLEKEVLALRQSVKKLNDSKQLDPVSGLLNRSYFLERSNAEFQRSQRFNHPLSIVIVKINSFQELTKMHGLAALDPAVKAISEICTSNCRTGTDLTGRVGESELAILLPQTGQLGAKNFAARVVHQSCTLSLSIEKAERPIKITANAHAVKSDDLAFLHSLCQAQQ